MLTLIHGDDIEASRAKLRELKQTGKEIRELDGKKIDPALLASQSMFGGDLLIVIENYLFDKSLPVIVEAAKQNDVVLYTPKEVTKANLSKLGASARVYLFKTPVEIFQFLDRLALPLPKEAPEIVYSLLLRRVRQLIQIKDAVTPEGLQVWQVSRLTNQARHFTMDRLITMHGNLVEIDIALKTGSTPYTLSQLLEQFVMTL